ncbi:hypothetical protein [Nonomuraea sp. NPDC050783]|uniref:hypothetical protein n=1 Tax=Nonomuraea sp. NPDC050783 TaxID=3154634 RepID=UPI00346521EE
MDKDRARQSAGESLLYFFVLLLLSGGRLAYFYTPSGETVAYTGWYEPLRGTPMTAAYESVLAISTDVPQGLLTRQLHVKVTTVLALGTVVWALLGRFRYALAVLVLIAVAGTAGYGAADEIVLVELPIPVWYGLHLAAALAIAVTLVVSSRREAARRPRTPAFVALAAGLALLAVYVL